MQLSDIQNDLLFALQQSEMVNFGQAPNWSQASNPGLTEAAVNFQINRSYMHVVSDLSDLQLALYRYVFASVAQVSDYPLPPAAPPSSTVLGSSFLGSLQLGAPLPAQGGIWGQGQWGSMIWGTSAGAPAVQRITRVIYSPQGQPYDMDLAGGIRLISWQEFQNRCGYGYLRPFTTDIIPQFAAMSPDRKMISFFPGTASAGDAIGIEYIPKITLNSDWPPLSQPTDEPQLPDETHDLIVMWATLLCCPKLKLFGMLKETKEMYAAELMRVREQLAWRSVGDNQRIQDSNDGLVLSSLISGTILP